MPTELLFICPTILAIVEVSDLLGSSQSLLWNFRMMQGVVVLLKGEWHPEIVDDVLKSHTCKMQVRIVPRQ